MKRVDLLQFLAGLRDGDFVIKSGRAYEEIAHRLGYSTESVSTAVGRLREQGLVTTVSQRGKGTFSITLTPKGWDELGIVPPPASKPAKRQQPTPQPEPSPDDGPIHVVDLSDIPRELSQLLNDALHPGVEAASVLHTWLDTLGAPLVAAFSEAFVEIVSRLQPRLDEYLAEAKARADAAETRADVAEAKLAELRDILDPKPAA